MKKQKQKLEVGTEVFAKHPFTAEMEEGIVLDIRERTEEYGRGPFYLVRFNRQDKKSAHAVLYWTSFHQKMGS